MAEHDQPKHTDPVPPATVVDFWFETLSARDWYRKSQTLDQLISARFGATLRAARLKPMQIELLLGIAPAVPTSSAADFLLGHWHRIEGPVLHGSHIIRHEIVAELVTLVHHRPECA